VEETHSHEVDVIGIDRLVAKTSAVDQLGSLRQQPIDGIAFRPIRPVPHEDGTVAEIARSAWDEIDQPIVQVHLTTTMAGRVRAWGLHRSSTDRLLSFGGWCQSWSTTDGWGRLRWGA
jgi:dTDP-4-dehydrorhamnose 3,5-epimerase